MTRRPNNLLTSSQSRALARRKAAASQPFQAVSDDAILGIIQREGDKRDLVWWGMGMDLVREIQALDPASRKEARLLVLDRLDRFPVRVRVAEEGN
jgi:hypothetical protein